MWFSFFITWEQRKFGEYFEERNERSGEGELISVTINSGIKKFNELGRFDSKPEDLSKYKRVEVGDIAYNSMRMWQGASGYSPYAGILSPAYTVITPKNGISSLFFAYLIKRPPMIHLFEINSQGLTSDTWNLKFPAFSQIEASAPFSVEEQDRIAELFGILDNLITLHQRKGKCRFYQVLWKILSSKMTVYWEQRKLGEISDSYSGGTPTVGVKEYYEGQIPFIRSAEINSEITELFLTEDGLKNSSARLVDLGDILYALYGATSGEVGRARIKGAINQAILAIKPHSGYDSEYLAQWLRKSKQSIIETYLQGGQGNLSGAIVKELLVDFPTFEEQQAIGAYFKQFDNLITLHQRKQNIMLTFKKCHFYVSVWQHKTTTWEQRKLGDIGRVAMNRRIFKEQTSSKGSVPFYKIGTFGGEPDAFISEELYQEYKEHFPYPKIGDILLSASGSIGKMVEYKGEKAYFQDSNIVWLDHDTSVTNVFLKCFYSVVKWAGLEGSTIKRLYNKNILETQITLPSFAEQVLIGSFFESIGNLITLHQRSSA